MSNPEACGISGTKYFETSLDHVLAELKLMALRLHSKVRKMRRAGEPDETERFKGLYISEKEIDDILEAPGEMLSKDAPGGKNSPPGPEESRIRYLEIEIANRKKETLKHGVGLRLDILQRLFALSQIEVDTLLICLLAEINLKYQKLYAYLQDDMTRKAPTVNLVLEFLCDSPGKAFRTREYFSAYFPLIKNQLITLQDDRLTGHITLLSKAIHIDERITAYLLDQDGIDPRLKYVVSAINPQKKWPDLVIPEDLKKRMEAFTAKNSGASLVCCLSESNGSNKLDMAEAVASQLGKKLLIVNIKALLSAGGSTDSLTSLVFREGSLQNGVIYLDGFDSLLGENKETIAVFIELIRELRGYSNWVLLGLEKEWQPEGVISGKPCINVRISSATYSERRQIWATMVAGDPGFAPGIDLADIAGKFRFNSGQIAQAIHMAGNLAKWRDPESGLVTSDDLYNACRKQSGENLNALTRKIQPYYRWEDIILPEDQMAQLHEICSYMEHYHTVYGDWGFAGKSSLGKGLKVLFAGPSGTGKTMAAEVIAAELKIDLYKIDLSTVVSKYIGETEKNLDKIFLEGQTSNAILFFDEADALFGKRSEIRDAHDRYANIETAYLLQKMDEYEGTVIMATNLRKNMDDAFARRMHFTLEFPLPEEKDRYRIWRQVFPQASPLDREIDFQFMARQFKISGGNIKNIALGAAFLAAANGRLITMEHLIKATKREYQKIGKLCTENDFGLYFDLVKN